MGLLSKIKSVGGSVKARAGSAIGALKSSKLGALGSRISKSPVGRIASKTGGIGGKISGILTVGTLAVSGVKALSKKSKKKEIKRLPMSKTGIPRGYSRKVANTAGTAGAIAGGAVLGAALKSQPQQKTSLVNRALSYAKENPVKTAIAVAAIGAAGYGIYKAVTRKKRKKSSKRSKKRKAPKRRSKSARRSSRSRTRRKRGYGTERQYKRKGGLDVKYTKNGQPYVIQANGRARFVKRSRR